MIPYSRQTVEADDVLSVEQTLRSDYLTCGPKVQEYENALRDVVGSSYVIACSSGTAALHLAMLTLGLGRGDAVIVPSVTFVATANVVQMCGAAVVFADVNPETGLVSPQTMDAALQRAQKFGRVRAAFAVHLNGQICDIVGLKTVLEPYGAELIEDATHALGANYRWDGSGSRIACFSTHPVKAIATGEGGFLATCDEELAKDVERLRSHGINRDPAFFTMGNLAFEGNHPNQWHYELHTLGWNYRLPDILCALGLSQLRKLPRFMERRATIARTYVEAFRCMTPLVRPVPRGERPDGLHLYPLLIDFTALGLSRRGVMDRLRGKGVGTQVHYIPVHLQPYYRARFDTPNLPGAMAYFERCLSIPLYPGLSDEEVLTVVEAVGDVAGRAA